VVVGEVDSGVENRRVETGECATVNDLIDEEGDWRNHGEFVRHVRHVTRGLVGDGVLDRGEATAVNRAAARSDIGRERGRDRGRGRR